MKMTIESTTRMVHANGVLCRVWQGKTERGVDVYVLIPRIAVPEGQDQSQLAEELKAHTAPVDEATRVFPLRMIL